MKRKRSYRQWVKAALLRIIVMIVMTGGTYGYSAYIETRMLSITNPVVITDQLPKPLQQLKIVQFSDTHLGKGYSVMQLDELVHTINDQHPDIVVFTGDLIDKFRFFTDGRGQVPEVLSKIEAPLGKYAVYGNHDRGGGASSYYRSCMEQAGFKLLVNERYEIPIAGNQKLVISGLDDYLLGNPEPESTLSRLQEQDYNIVLVHEPDVAETWGHYPVDLILAGHSHGGQVQLPLIGPVITPPLAEKYVEGLYELEGEHRSRYLYVNRGIGTTRKPIRFNSKPELTVLSIVCPTS